MLRLGADASRVLLARVPADLAEKNQNLYPGLERQSRYGFHDRGWRIDSLDLITDIGDPAAVPALLQLAEKEKNALSRNDLADTLIRCGDRRAAPWLFRFAQAANTEIPLRESAFSFVCRCGEAEGLSQREVTAYLLARFRDPATPSWLRRYARFELLNDRGESARKAALRTFQRIATTRWLPQGDLNSVPGVPTSFAWSPLGHWKGRAADGTWWTVGNADYLGRSGIVLWAAQSKDGKKWVRPALVEDLSSIMTSLSAVEVRPVGTALRLSLRGEKWTPDPLTRTVKTRVIKLERTVQVDDLYRDTDRDLLPDRLEHLLGSDPRKADTNGNGIPDGLDKTPALREHPLTDEEGIYAAAVDAVCQMSGTFAREKPIVPGLEVMPVGLGRRKLPLRLPLPPGSNGVEVPGYPGPLFFQRIADFHQTGLVDDVVTGGNFAPPRIGFDGVLREAPLLPFASNWDSWNALSESPHEQFLRVFPYELSSDGITARVGWIELNRFDAPAFRYDIEVRKVEGKWYPVEFRQVNWSRHRMFSDSAAAPVRPLH